MVEIQSMYSSPSYLYVNQYFAPFSSKYVLRVLVLRVGAGFLVLCAGVGVLVLLRLGKFVRGVCGGGEARGA